MASCRRILPPEDFAEIAEVALRLGLSAHAQMLIDAAYGGADGEQPDVIDALVTGIRRAVRERKLQLTRRQETLLDIGDC